MRANYQDCPDCESDIEFLFKLHTAEDCKYFVLEEVIRHCDCLIGERRLEKLEEKALADVTADI